MEVKGQIVKIFPTRKISEKFQVREFVIKTDDTYPQEIILQLSQDRCGLIDSSAEGENVSASINLRGRSWTNPQGETKYFNTIE